MISPILKVFKHKKTFIFLFFVINIFFGAIGVWVPLIQPLFAQNGVDQYKLSEMLASGGVYTFDIAYLATATGYIIFEYLDQKDPSYKTAKAIAGVIALMLVVLCLIFNTIQLTTSVATQPTNGLGNQGLAPIWLTILSILTGFSLALIQWAGPYRLATIIEENTTETHKEATRLMSEANKP